MVDNKDLLLREKLISVQMDTVKHCTEVNL